MQNNYRLLLISYIIYAYAGVFVMYALYLHSRSLVVIVEVIEDLIPCLTCAIVFFVGPLSDSVL